MSGPSERAVKAPPYAIGSDTWPGLAKLSEEMGEVQQIIGKLMAYPDGDHPDGDGPLARRLADEIEDVRASIAYVHAHNPLPRDPDRFTEKFNRFQRWDGEERTQ